MGRRPGLMLAATTLVALTLAPLWAVPTRVQAQDDRALARDAFRRGVAHYSAGDFQAALESFQEAYRIAPNPVVRVNMANCYERLDRPDEAIFNYERFLSEAGADAPAARRSEVETALAALRARFAQLSLSVSPGDSATIAIDGGNDAPPPPQPIQLSPGHHVIEVHRPGSPPQRRELELAGGTVTSFDVTSLTPPPPPRAPTPTPTTSPPVGGEPVVAVTPPSGEPEQEPTPSTGGGLRITAPVLVAGGATIALAIGATVTGALALGANSDFDAAVAEVQSPDTSPDARAAARQRGLDAADSANTLALVTDILVAGAVVGAGVTVVLLLTQPGSSTERATRARPRTVAAPTFGRDRVGLVVQGTF